MASAPYEVRFDLSDGESFEFTIPFEMKNGDAFPFGDYAWTYILSHKGGGETFRLTSASGGVALDPAHGWATFTNPTARLGCGHYEHELLLTHLATGKTLAFFGGPVRVARGNR